MRGNGQNFNKAAESKEPGAAVAPLQSPCLMNLGWSLPRAGGKVLAQGQKLLYNRVASPFPLSLARLYAFTAQLPPPKSNSPIFLAFQ